MAKKKVEDIRPGERLPAQIEIEAVEIKRTTVIFHMVDGTTVEHGRETRIEFLDPLPTPLPVTQPQGSSGMVTGG